MIEMEWGTFTSIVDKADLVDVGKITLLGGEPTTYSQLSKACDYILSKDINEIRIVTNGTKPYWHFINTVKNLRNIFTIFSIDGATEDTHDLIRGDGVFNVLNESIERARSSGISIAGITSLSKKNYDEISDIVHLCDEYNFEYINVHKTSNTGFASEKDMLSPQEWLDIRSELIDISYDVDVTIKFDRKYVERSEYEEMNEFQRECYVKSGTNGNVMIYPDGRVYRCSLFMDQKDTHNYEWRENGIVESQANGKTEETICNSCDVGCPGVSAKQKRERPTEFITLCMYRKEVIEDGGVSVHK